MFFLARRRRDEKEEINEEMYWNSFTTVNPTALEVIRKHQMSSLTATNYTLENIQRYSKRIFLKDKDYKLDCSGIYNEAKILTTDLFYKV